MLTTISTCFSAKYVTIVFAILPSIEMVANDTKQYLIFSFLISLYAQRRKSHKE